MRIIWNMRREPQELGQIFRGVVVESLLFGIWPIRCTKDPGPWLEKSKESDLPPGRDGSSGSSTKEESLTKSQQKAIRILIVDDHEVIRAGLAELLGVHWTICGEASNSEEAIRKVRELGPDLVVLDLSIPGKGGAAVARTIRHLSPNTRIVFYSMHEGSAVADLARLLGVDAFVTKRQPTSDLIETIKHVSRG